MSKKTKGFEMTSEEKVEAIEKVEAKVKTIQPEVVLAPAEVLINFNQYWSKLMRRITIRPAYKEIIKVDFIARGYKMEETSETYDKALGEYGIQL